VRCVLYQISLPKVHLLCKMDRSESIKYAVEYSIKYDIELIPKITLQICFGSDSSKY